MIQLQRRGNFKLAEPSAAAPVKTGASLPIPANEKLGSAVVGWGAVIMSAGRTGDSGCCSN